MADEGLQDGRPSLGLGRASALGSAGLDPAGMGGAPAGSPGDAPGERVRTEEERVQHALDLAYKHLAKRDRTVAEVRQRLERRAVGAPSIRRAIAELEELGYLDDDRYARRFVEDRRRIEGWGRLRIAQGLSRMGVPDAIAERALAEDPEADSEPEMAADALERRWRGLPLGDDRERAKALRFLVTRGFGLDTAYEAVRTHERRARGDE